MDYTDQQYIERGRFGCDEERQIRLPARVRYHPIIREARGIRNTPEAAAQRRDNARSRAHVENERQRRKRCTDIAQFGEKEFKCRRRED